MDENAEANPGEEAQSTQEVGGTDTAVVGTNVKAEEGDKPSDQQPAPKEGEGGPPEGFDSWEDYGRAQHKAAQEEKASGDDGGGEGTTPALGEDFQQAIAALPEDKQEAATEVATEFEESGTLSAEAKAKASEAWNVPPQMVDVYLAGLQAEAAPIVAQAEEAAGGKESLEAFKDWANNGGYDEAQTAEFNKGLDTDPVATIKKAVAAWKEEGNGPGPKDATRETPSKEASKETVGFKSSAEMERAMGDPRYKKDAAYRAEVEAKVAASSF